MGLVTQVTPQTAGAILRDLQKKGRNSRREIGLSRKQSKLKSRFGTDDRTESEKTLHWRRLAEFGSYIGQAVGFFGAVYSVYRLIYNPSLEGIVNTLFFVGLLLGFEFLERWTSDEFWDAKAAGQFSIRFFIINFVVIWGISTVISAGGIYLVSKDTHGDPQLYDDPQVAAIRAEIATLRAENEDYKNGSQYRVSGGKDKGEIRWGIQESIVANDNQIAKLNATLSERYNVTASVDEAAVAYHKTLGNSRLMLMMFLFLFARIIFETSMWYRSKWDRIKYAEDVASGEIDDPEFLAYLRGQLGKA